MLKMWAKLVKDNKLTGQAVVPIDEALSAEQTLKVSLEEIAGSGSCQSHRAEQAYPRYGTVSADALLAGIVH